VTGGLELVALAPSLGGVFTTVLHPASTSHASLTPRELKEGGIGEGTIRIATGLERVDDLWRDFEQALDRI
jgi:methionine-gamma-lyase